MQPGFRRSSKKTALIFTLQAWKLNPTTFPAGNVSLTTGIPSSKQENGLFFHFIGDPK
jgi:hypothetical protein